MSRPPNPLFTANEERIVAMLRDGLSYKRISDALGFPVQQEQVRRLRQKHGMKAKVFRPKLTGKQVGQIAAMLQTGKSLRQIAAEMDANRDSVATAARPIIAAMREAGTLGRCECGKERYHQRICSKNAGPLPQTSPEQIARRGIIVGDIMRGDTFATIAQRHGIATVAGARSYLRYLTPPQRERRKILERQRRREAEQVFRPHGDQLYAAIAAATPRWTSEQLRDDIISDLYLAVLEGEVTIENIREAARRATTQAVQSFESRFALSIDRRVFEDGRDTYADMIPDPAAIAAFDYIFEDAAHG